MEAVKFLIRVFIGGRGSGKSTVLGDIIYEFISTMPRARAFLASYNLETIKNFSLPSIIARLEELGEIQGEDFVVNIRPPDWFEKPYQPPTSFKNVMSFSNGCCIDLISMYTKNAGRGANFQMGMFDEAGLINKETHDKALLGTMRGNLHKVARFDLEEVGLQPEEIPFGKVVKKGGRMIWEAPFRENPLYLARFYVSSMPWTASGKWLLDFEEDPNAFFVESTAFDNIEVLGEEYIDNLRESLPSVIFDVEVMNQRLTKVENGFYSEFDEDKHTITKPLYDPTKELDISLDFNTGFNSLIVGQFINQVAYVHENIYVKGNLIVEDLIEEFLRKYDNHQNKRINIYGDRNGNNKRADSRKTIYEGIEEQLIGAGWQVYRPHKGLDAPHKDKHEKINLALRERPGSGLPKIRINKFGCKALIISVNQAPLADGFKKDKRSERRLTGTDHREEATDLSDCLDNWYMFRFDRFSLYSFSDGAGAGVGGGVGGF